MTITTQTTPFNAADHITTTADQAYLLADAVSSGDAIYIATALNVIATARKLDTSQDALTTLLSVVRLLGLRLVAVPE